jgi:hypothetical protein
MDNDKADTAGEQESHRLTERRMGGVGAEGNGSCLKLSKAALQSTHRDATSEELIGGVR